MSSEITTITSKVRNLIADTSSVVTDIFTYNTSAVFTLTEDNPSTISTVLVNDVELGSGDYSLDTTTNKVTLTSSGLTAGDIIEIKYTAYKKYSATEISNYIEAALVYISAGNYYDFTVNSDDIYPTPSDKELNLISLIAATIMEPNNTIRLPDITITGNDKPLGDKIGAILARFKKDSHGIFIA